MLLSIQSSTSSAQSTKSQSEPPPEEELVIKSIGARIDSEGNYVISPDDFSLIWTEITQLEFEVKMKDVQIKALEELVRKENARANAEARARSIAESQNKEKTLIIKIVLITSVVLIGGGITIGVVTQ